MADMSRTEIGRRMYSLQKEKNVERVIEKIRKQLGSDWVYISQEDQNVLKYVIGEVWVYRERDFWEMVQYTRLTVKAILDIVSIGRKLMSHESDPRKSVEEASEILRLGSGQGA
ncbi:MAG TPA: hypothetical protein PK069_05675 [Methanolinea sp.]|nr:hypothetical protein [Methanolinea sp.]HQK55934.1 hypothetical protein [Methanolinea sp.]